MWLLFQTKSPPPPPYAAVYRDDHCNGPRCLKPAPDEHRKLPRTGTASQQPAPRAAPPALTKTAPDPSILAQTSAPALTFHGLNQSNGDAKLLYDYRSSRFSSSPPQYGSRRDFTAKMQAEYRTLDTCRVPLQFFPHTDRTEVTQLLVYSMYDVLSCIINVADPSDSVTVRSPTWILGWHASLLKLTKASKFPNRDDAHALHPLVDDLFAQLQEQLASGVNAPAAFRALLIALADYFDRAPRGTAVATLQRFGVPFVTPFLSHLHYFRVAVASTVDKGEPLAPPPEMAMELIHIRTTQQYPMLVLTLIPGK